MCYVPGLLLLDKTVRFDRVLRFQSCHETHLHCSRPLLILLESQLGYLAVRQATKTALFLLTISRISKIFICRSFFMLGDTKTLVAAFLLSLQ